MYNKDNVTNPFSGTKANRFFGPLRAILLAIFLIGAAILALPVTETYADGPDQAHVVVQFADNDVAVRPISFTAPISGLAALEMSGLDIITHESSFGISVCSIEGVGCPASDCFCSSNYWGYNFWNGAQWEGYQIGAATSVISNGAVEGWRWGAFDGAMQLPAPPIIAAAEALEWVKTRQSITDGSYSQSPSASIDTMLAVKANRLDPETWQRSPTSPSLSTYLVGQAVSATTISGSQPGGADIAGKYLAAFGDMSNLLPVGTKFPLDYISGSAIFTGNVGIGTGPQAWAIIGTAAASQTVPTAATQYLHDLRQSNGSWEWQAGFGGDSNATALALQALVATGEPVSSAAVRCGLAYLKSAQNADGGFSYTPGGKSDANSTAWVVQALWATQQDPFSTTWTINNTNPISFLLNLQLADGSFAWREDVNKSNLLATQQAILALLGTPLPLHPALPPLPTGSALLGSPAGFCQGLYLPIIGK